MGGTRLWPRSTVPRMARYSPEVRSQAVHMVLDDERAVKDVAGELGIGKSTLRTWVKEERDRRRGEWWAAQVVPVFGFLGEYGFALSEVRAGDWWKISAVYRAERAAVEVVYSVEFRRVEVNLTRAALLDLPTLSNGDVFVIGV